MSNTVKVPVMYVYYRQIPTSLEKHILSIPTLSITKDGVLKGAGHSCPRLTIKLNKTNTDADKMILKKLEKILDGLESRNEIVMYNTVSFK